jgi:hypothetical protein
MLFGLAVGVAIGAGMAVRHYFWPWERPPVVIYRNAPVVVEREVLVEKK